MVDRFGLAERDTWKRRLMRCSLTGWSTAGTLQTAPGSFSTGEPRVSKYAFAERRTFAGKSNMIGQFSILTNAVVSIA